VDVVLVAAVGLDRILGVRQHEVVVAIAHEHHVRVAAHLREAEDLGVEFLGSVEILHGDGEVEDAGGFDHGAPDHLFVGWVKRSATQNFRRMIQCWVAAGSADLDPAYEGIALRRK
jgi:hypothetical protein